MYIGITVKLVLNMHDLNNERAEEIRRVPLIYRDEKGEWQVFEEAVAVSGVMVKHWHFAYMVTLGTKEEVNFCDYCNRLEAIRVLSGTTGDELELIKRCAGEDIHGFLRAKPPLRRESLARFSWMLPLLNEEAVKTFGLSTPFRVLQHSRNVRVIPEVAPEEVRQAQMPYPRSYANGVYGFISTLDLDHVGYSFTNGKYIDDDQVLKRRKIAVQAYLPMLTGAIGASLARALPVSDALEVLVATSDKPIPAPVHPIYPDYINENVNLYGGIGKVMETDVTIYVWSKERKIEEKTDERFNLIPVGKPADTFAYVIEKLNEMGKATKPTKGKK
jgi:CRISPR-associated protein Cst2